jgi:DNA polymerase III epsilon subunit-like protein
MDYLFFDVECANCFEGTGKLCEFGYVLTDQQFNIIKKENLLINPSAKFDPYVIKKMLNFTEQEYAKNPRFDKFYDKIIGLITAKDRLVIGHTVGGDAKYVGSDCMRYKLDPPDFEHVDIVEIYKGINDQKDAVSLAKMSELFQIEVPENVHCALVDAELTMLCAKAMVENSGQTLLELIEKYPRAKGKLENYKQEYTRKKLHKQFLIDLKRKGIKEMTGEQKSLLNDFRRFARSKGKPKRSALSFKRVCISYNYEGYNFADMLKIVQLVASHGGKVIGRATKCDIFVNYDIRYPEGLVYCQRKEQAETARKNGKRIRFMGFDEFLTILGTDRNAIKQMQSIDVLKVIRTKKISNTTPNSENA